MDISNLIIQLQAKVNDLTYNQLAVAKSIELLKTGQVNYANSISELPSATASNGKMYYVRSLGIYYSNGTSWTTIETFNYTIQNILYSWGNNTNGRLGDNTVVAKSSPVSVVGGFTDWCQVSAGYSMLGVKQDGTAWGWGRGNYGVLGNNCTTCRSSPVSVVGGFTDWCQVSTAGSHSLAVRQNSTLWAWGANQVGQLGDNSLSSRSSPVSIVGGFTDWCQTSAGGTNSLGVRQNGTAWAWGCGGSGRLGDNSTTNRSSPVSIVGGFTDWCKVSAGYSHAIGIRTNGTIWTWGVNTCGGLGDRTTVSKSSPVSVVGDFTDWCQVSAGREYSLAVRTNGTIWAWGCNNDGQLGDNTVVAKSSPVSVVGGFTDWCQVSAGSGAGGINSAFTLALRQNGTAWGWGANGCGRLGDNTVVAKSSPVSVVGGFTDWCQISAGSEGALAIRAKTDS